MRIGIDAREAFRSEPRGIGLYVRNLLREYANCADREFVLYHQLPKPDDLEFAANMRACLTDIPGGRLHSWERLQMPWRIRRDKLDVYHGTYNTLPPPWRLWPGPPMVVTLHDVIVTWWPQEHEDLFVSYARKVTPRVVRDATVILTVSNWSRNDICERFDCDPAKVRICYNGLHPMVLAGAPEGAAAAARAHHADDRPYLFSVGAPLERKNTGRLIEAFGRLRARRPDLPHLLLISGLKQHTGRFGELAAKAGVTDHVRFLPYLDRAELIALYAGAALTIYPSRIEGWGLPVSESLAIGTPVLTSNTSAMPEAGGEFAHYFDPTSTESLATAIDEALDDYVPAFAARRDDAMRFARSLTWGRAAETTLAAYHEVATTSR